MSYYRPPQPPIPSYRPPPLPPPPPISYPYPLSAPHLPPHNPPPPLPHVHPPQNHPGPQLPAPPPLLRPPLPPPLPPSLPPPTPPPPLPPARTPETQFTPAPRGSEINQFPHQERPNYKPPQHPPLAEESTIPPLFPHKEVEPPPPKPLFPNPPRINEPPKNFHNEPPENFCNNRQENFHNEPPENFHDEPPENFCSEPPENFHNEPPACYDRQSYSENRSHWDKGGRDRNFQQPPERGFSPPREPWQDASPPHGQYLDGPPRRPPPVGNFGGVNYSQDGPQRNNQFYDDYLRYREGPPRPNFRPGHPDLRPGPHLDRVPCNPPEESRGDFYPPCDNKPRGSPTRQNFHSERPPDRYFPHSSPGYDERPPDFCRDRPPEFTCPPEFDMYNQPPESTRHPDFNRPLEATRHPDFNRPPESTRPPDFNRPPESTRPPDFNRPPEFDRPTEPPDFDRVSEFHQPPDFDEVTEFNRPSEFPRPPDFDQPRGAPNRDDFRHPSSQGFHHDDASGNFHDPPVNHRWSGDQIEGNVRLSPHRGGQEFHHHRDPAENQRRLPLLPTPVMGVPDFPKPEIKTVMAEKIFDTPGRSERPSHIVIIIRGLPGSGKSHIAKLIRDKEVNYGAHAPRLLSLDSYFLTEVEKMERDPETGRRVKKMVQEYEYEPEMEQTYRASLLKTYNKTLEEGFFPMIVVDAPNTKVHHFDRYWSNGKVKGFEVYIVELIDSIDVCVARNIHHRTRHDIEQLAREWEETPPHFIRLDITALLSDSNIDEVEMECTGSESEGEEEENGNQPSEAQNQDGVVKSRWEEASEERLDKLDAVEVFRKRKRLHSEPEGEEEEGEELSLLEYLRRRDEKNVSGKKRKRVRWADLEAKKHEERQKREVGFCIGGSWGQVSEEEAQAILTGAKTTDDTS